MSDVQKVADSVLDVVVSHGDLDSLSPQQRGEYYAKVCSSLGLNPLTRPLEFIRLNGKLQLYAKKDATDQLRRIYNVSITVVDRSNADGMATVIARATLPNGRTDEEIGAVPTGKLQGDALANALMKASTKAKRRVTLSVCGLGFLDETEIETIPKEAVGEVDKQPAFSLEQDKVDVFKSQLEDAAEPGDRGRLREFLRRKGVKEWLERLERNSAKHPRVWAEVQQAIAEAHARCGPDETLPIIAPDRDNPGGEWREYTVEADEGEPLPQAYIRWWRDVLRAHPNQAETMMARNRQQLTAIADRGSEYDAAAVEVSRLVDVAKDWLRKQEEKKRAKQPEEAMAK